MRWCGGIKVVDERSSLFVAEKLRRWMPFLGDFYKAKEAKNGLTVSDTASPYSSAWPKVLGKWIVCTSESAAIASI
ncbi:MAG: hypothetical protein AAFX01_01080 [Cyanobacteria bacterium J06638_28]